MAELSEAAQEELLGRCEVQFSQLEKLQNEIILSEPDFCDNLQELSVNRLVATEAELKKWLTVEPQLLAENSEIILKAGKEEMLKLCSQLEMVVSCYETKRDNLRQTKEVEQMWLEEKNQALMAATEHIQQLKLNKEKQSELSLLQDMKMKIQKMKLYEESLMECLGDILEKHVPVPQTETESTTTDKKNKKKKKKKKSVGQESNEDFISLNEILELLMNKVLSTPHDPYIAIDGTFWPPYIEMLLRYSIAVRHQENPFKIRLETFC